MANLYGIIGTHPPNVCPISNKASREAAKKTFGMMPNLAQKYKVKFVGQYHFDPKHLGIIIVEAENVESVRDMVTEAGMVHWVDLEIYPETPLDKWMGQIDKYPTIY